MVTGKEEEGVGMNLPKNKRFRMNCFLREFSCGIEEAKRKRADFRIVGSGKRIYILENGFGYENRRGK